jgi:hypothetical protein
MEAALGGVAAELKVMPTACRAIAQEGRRSQGGGKRTGHSKAGWQHEGEPHGSKIKHRC